MNEFVSWCRYLLVSFLFHVLTSLHPPSFHRNDFSTCSTHFSFILVQSPEMFSLRRAHEDYMHAHAHAENLHVHAHVNGVVQCQPWKSPTIYRLVKKSAPRLVLVRR